MKLEVGMYVRTERFGRVGKYLRNDKECSMSYIVIMDDKNCEYTIPRETIKVASHNIIDLIEVGDYINGELVEYIEVDSYKDYVINSGYWCNQENIKSIVTKEVFQSNEYRVETN